MSANVPGELSSDGGHYWNGRQWISTLSPDGAHRWNGSAWVPVATSGSGHLGAGPPGSVDGSVDGSAGGPAALGVPATGLPHYGASGPVAARQTGLGWQFGGSAAWSIGFGLAAIVAPLYSHFYFPILPVFGLWRAYLAFRAGRVAGAGVGLIVNILGGIASLLASGLIQ